MSVIEAFNSKNILPYKKGMDVPTDVEMKIVSINRTKTVNGTALKVSLEDFYIYLSS